MPDQLNYRPSNSAVYYVAPDRIDIRRTLWSYPLAAAGAAIGAFIYGHFQSDWNNFYLRVGALAVAAGAVGLLALIPVKVGRIRIPILAAFLGATIALLALYIMWLEWVHTVFKIAGMSLNYGQMILHPLNLLQLIRLLNRTGTWSYKGDLLQGFPLLVLWLGEAAALLAAGVFIPLNALYSDDPVCRYCNIRCTRAKSLPRFSAAEQDKFLAIIESRNFPALLTQAPPEHEDAPELSITLMSCPRCQETHILSINQIAWHLTNTQTTVKTIPLINKLLITPEEAQHLKQICAEIQTQRTTPTSADPED
jgi:hypothetical protein